MEKSIEGAKKLIELQVTEKKIGHVEEDFQNINKSYYWTNENIPGYLDLVSFGGKTNALSVASSGDHAFNLITKGITNIDTFDINCLTEYFAFGFKRAMILKYDYSSFLNIMKLLRSPFTRLDTLSDILTSLLPYMDSKHRIYWNAIIDFNYKIQREHGTNLNLFLMLTNAPNFLEAKEFNSYLKNEESYERLRRRLSSANITFRNVGAANLAQEYVGNQYDFLLLSNIPEYLHHDWGKKWNYRKFLEYEKELEQIINEDGTIFLHYIISYLFKNKIALNIFGKHSSATIFDIRDREIQQISAPPINNQTRIDGMILKRVKKPTGILLK